MHNRVLFVDDDPKILAALQRQLRKKVEIETVTSGRDGLDVLRREGPFPVVVTDYCMPEMNGIEFLTEVRKVAPETVRMLLTGSADLNAAIQAVNQGNISRFHTKPCSSDALLDALKTGMREYRHSHKERKFNRRTHRLLAQAKKNSDDVCRQRRPLGRRVRAGAWRLHRPRPAGERADRDPVVARDDRPNNAVIQKLAADFNAAQKDYKVVPTFKGNYADTLNAGIAAFRAGNAPHIMQVFEVGTATMMAAKGAVKPVQEMMKEAGEKFDPAAYLRAITGYYSTAKGEMLSFPFNSSSTVMWYNKDAFKKAGLDPEKPPRTWPETFEAAKKLKAAGHATCGMSTAWITWLMIEQFSAWHNLPLGTKANGMDGFDTEFKFNSPVHVRHLQNLVDLQKDKTFDYGGRTNTGEGRFTSGECPIMLTSSAFYGNVKANAKFDFGAAMMPYYPDVAGAPQNSIIGGA